MKLDELAHEIRNGIQGIKQATNYCKKSCPQTFHSVEVRTEITHHANRIERALKVYESYKKLQRLESPSTTN
jgi:nitrogen-specific signal transduction histidine kinase